MSDNLKCLQCGWLITIPPFGLGECTIHEGPHKQKEYCADWMPLRREDAYCNPKCQSNGRLVRERPSGKVAPSPESRPISGFPIGAAVKSEFDVDENVAGAPVYFITGKSGGKVLVSRLDPTTRTRESTEVLASMSVCLA